MMFSSNTNGVGLGRLARIEVPGILMAAGLYRDARTDAGRIVATKDDGTQEVLVMGCRRFGREEEAQSKMTHIPNSRFEKEFGQSGIWPGAIFVLLDAQGTTLTITALPRETIDKLLDNSDFLTQDGTLLLRYQAGFEQAVRKNGGRVITFQSSLISE